ncbi:MAG: hypothetical protein FWB73_00120 [Treponema sp.]|nr:hypothetical protein [Treponema sp.]
MKKINLSVHATYHEGHVYLKAVNESGKNLIEELFRKKTEWQERNKKEYFLQTTMELRYQKRTVKQNSSVWVLVTAIHESLEGRLPDEDEKYALYLDLLDEYAVKKPSKITGKLRPVHISEANSAEAAYFIDNLISHLAQYCELTTEQQSTVIDALQGYHEWRGELEIDPSDYSDIECTQLLTEAQWRKKHTVSESSGRGGAIVLHHIVTRGSNKAAEDKAWNWLSLTHDEHTTIHEKGDDYFLRVYPHLRGKFKRANKLARALLHT